MFDVYEGFRRNRGEGLFLIVIREVGSFRLFCLLRLLRVMTAFWVMTIFCVAESGSGGSTTDGWFGGALLPARPPSTVGVPGLPMRFASLLDERRRDVVCIVPVSVPFLEFLNPTQ